MTRRRSPSLPSQVVSSMLTSAMCKSYFKLLHLTTTSPSSQWHSLLTDLTYTLTTLDLNPFHVSRETCPLNWLLRLPITHKVHQMILESVSDEDQVIHPPSGTMNARVVFKSLEQSYPTDGRIDVQLINGSGKFSIGDRVTLRHFADAEAIATFVARREHVNSYSLKATVDLMPLALSLAKEDRFYLSYESGEKTIANSTYFHITRPNGDELVEAIDSDDDEFIVIKSEKALFQDRIHHLAYENGVLEYQNRALAQKIKCLEEELAQFKLKSRRNHHH